MKKVEFDLSAEQDCLPFEGNCMASGDDDFDKECEDAIRTELENGNVWAWASVTMTASVDIDECWDALACCSYKDRADFESDAYYLDMKDESLRLLRIEHTEALEAIEHAEEELATERAAYDKRQAEMEWWRCPKCKGVIRIDPSCDDIHICADCNRQRDRYDPVDVVFLRDTEDGDVFAVFPSEAATVGNPYHMTCYVQIGGHSGAGTAYCDECREVTDPTEYADISTELDRIGYNLRVVRKDSMGDAKYFDSRRQQLQM